MRRITGMLVVLLVSCTNNTRVPSEFIQLPRMQKILGEMTEADRFASSFISIHKDSLGRQKQQIVDVYDKVFSYNKVSREDFLKSYNFYLGRPDLMKLMYDSISAQADRRRADIHKRPKPDFNRPRLDSLKHKTDSIRTRADSIRIHADSIRRANILFRKADSAKRKISSKPSLRLPHE